MNKEEFKKRRQAVANNMQEDSIAIVFAASVMHRNRDTEYSFRQNSNFYYLTGLDESDSVMVLIKRKQEVEFILFVLPKDIEKEVWTGSRVGTTLAQQKYAADMAYSLTDLETQIKKIAKEFKVVYYLAEDNIRHKEKIYSWWNPTDVRDLYPIISELRLIKSAFELDILRKVGSISAEAHKNLMLACGPNKYEYELQANFYNSCVSKGCQDVAYPSIVAGGVNACTLHYTKNRSVLKDGDILLVDAGGELHNYASDITRSYPVNGKFSAAQKEIYNIVLESQLTAISMVKPGNTIEMLQQAILDVLIPALIELKILSGKAKTIISKKSYTSVYMHNCSHWLGLDVHDVGSYKIAGKTRQLEPGMVLTVEPGLYFGPHLDFVPQKYHKIGIRIEDTVAVTENGCDILTSRVPKDIEEIELLMQ